MSDKKQEAEASQPSCHHIYCFEKALPNSICCQQHQNSVPQIDAESVEKSRFGKPALKSLWNQLGETEVQPQPCTGGNTLVVQGDPYHVPPQSQSFLQIVGGTCFKHGPYVGDCCPKHAEGCEILSETQPTNSIVGDEIWKAQPQPEVQPLYCVMLVLGDGFVVYSPPIPADDSQDAQQKTFVRLDKVLRKFESCDMYTTQIGGQR